MATSSRFAPINDHHITSYISELQTYLDQRRSQYRGPAEYTPMSDMELGGFNCSVTILDTSGTRYKSHHPLAGPTPENSLRMERLRKSRSACSAMAWYRLPWPENHHGDDVISLVQGTWSHAIAEPDRDSRSRSKSITGFDLDRLCRLERMTGHTFANKSLALRALRHSSASVDNHDALAFLGDATIGYLMAMQVYKAQPEAKKGDLSMRRSDMVRNKYFEDTANRIGMTQLLEIGSGMGRDKVEGKMVADMFEAVIGVLILEGDADAVLKFWQPAVER